MVPEPKVTLRPMEAGDLAAVSELGIRSKASWGYSPEEMAIFAAELTLDEVCLGQLLEAQVAVAGHGELVGYFTMRHPDQGGVELEHLFVEPDWFGKGIGSAQFGAALHSAVLGCSRTDWCANDYQRPQRHRFLPEARSAGDRTPPLEHPGARDSSARDRNLLGKIETC